MTVQKSKDSLAIDSLLETKIKTNSTQDYKIKSGGLLFQPKLITTYEDKKKITIPTLDGIAASLVKDYDEAYIVNELDIENKEYNDLESDEFRKYLLSYFMSDQYYDYKIQETNAKKIVRYSVPVVCMLAEKEDGSLSYIMIEKPFRNKYIKDIFKLIESNQIISVTYEKNKPVLKLDEDINIPITIKNAEKMPIQVSNIENRTKTFCWEYLYESEYNNWLKVPISSFEQKENGKHELIVKSIEQPWLLNDPEFWNTSHPTVKLVENFADGNPSLLEYVYIRPENKSYNSDIDTISNDYGWELAIEKPHVSKDKTDYSLRWLSVLMTILFCTFIFTLIIFGLVIS